MPENGFDLTVRFPVRRTVGQKRLFEEAVREFAALRGYALKVEPEAPKCRNLVIGCPETAQYLIAAGYDTGGVCRHPERELPYGHTAGLCTVLEIMDSLQKNLRESVCFVLFDCSGWRKLGPRRYARRHRESLPTQILINLDCVGAGDQIQLIPNQGLLADPEKKSRFYRACGYFGKKSVLLREKSSGFGPKVPGFFPYGVSVCTVQQRGVKKLFSALWDWEKAIPDRTNVNILRAALITLISGV